MTTKKGKKDRRQAGNATMGGGGWKTQGVKPARVPAQSKKGGSGMGKKKIHLKEKHIRTPRNWKSQRYNPTGTWGRGGFTGSRKRPVAEGGRATRWERGIRSRQRLEKTWNGRVVVSQGPRRKPRGGCNKESGKTPGKPPCEWRGLETKP